jgi:hypothetical protein
VPDAVAQGRQDGDLVVIGLGRQALDYVDHVLQALGMLRMTNVFRIAPESGYVFMSTRAAAIVFGYGSRTKQGLMGT